MTDHPSTARHLNRSVAFLTMEREKLAATSVCEVCGREPAVEAHLIGGCHVEPDPDYSAADALGLCRGCHNAQDECPRPPETRFSGTSFRWP